MQPSLHHISQAEFARKVCVSRAAVSQWKSKDILTDDAFTGPGKSGKIIYEVAVEQVRRNRDIGQSLGNGIATRTTVDDAPQMESAAAPDSETAPGQQPSLPMEKPAPIASIPGESADAEEYAASSSLKAPKPDSVEDQLKHARLEQQLRINRMQAAEEAKLRGELLSARDARDQMNRIAVAMLQIFEGALPDMASKLAERFDVPQRDVLHLLHDQFRKLRAEAARKEQARVQLMSQETEASLKAAH